MELYTYFYYFITYFYNIPYIIITHLIFNFQLINSLLLHLHNIPHIIIIVYLYNTPLVLFILHSFNYVSTASIERRTTESLFHQALTL